MNKTQFLAATKCVTMAWYQARHKSPPLDEAARFRMEQGREVGAFARHLLPSGNLVQGPREWMIAHTQELIVDDDIKTIFEATFSAGTLTAKVDVLNRNGDGWDVIEVKSGFSADKYVDDLAYTVMVLRSARVPIRRSSLLLLSRNYRRGDPAHKMFTCVDKTAEVDTRSKTFAEDAPSFVRKVDAEQLPDPALCSACRACDFFKTKCLGRQYEHTVLELPSLHHTKLKRLSDSGIVDITAVPDDLQLNDLQRRVKTAATSGSVFVSTGLGRELNAIDWPCHYLDFETVSSALPLYDGHGCHRPVLTQFSVHHRDSPDAEPRHSEFLADAEQSQELLLARRLIEVLGTEGAIIVYGNFEDIRIKALIKQFPTLVGDLGAVRARLVDLQKIIKKHVYHPAFAGRFSLKKVVPVLVSGVGYEELEIADGDSASATFARMARGEIENVPEARESLLAYCKTDTLVMVNLHKTLVGMAA